MCPFLNQSLWLGEMVLSLTQRLGAGLVPWTGSQGEVIPQRQAGGLDARQAKASGHPSPPLVPSHEALFFLAGLGCLGHGSYAVLLCVWPGNRVRVSCFLSVAGWPPGNNSYLCRGDSTYSLKVT